MNEYRNEAQDKDWEKISDLLHAADCVPDAPDCRSAVMQRLAKPKPRLQYQWAFGAGFAALIIASIVFIPFLTKPVQRDRVAYSPKTTTATPAPAATPEKPLPQRLTAPGQPAPSQTALAAKQAVRRKSVMMASSGSTSPETLAFGIGTNEKRGIPTRASFDRGTPPPSTALADGGLKMKEADPPTTGYPYHTLKSVAADTTPDAKSIDATVAPAPSSGDALLARKTTTEGVPAAATRGTALEAYTTLDNAGAAAPSSAENVRLAKVRPGRGGEAVVAASPVIPTKRTGGNGAYFDHANEIQPLGGSYSAAAPIALAMVTWPSNARPSDSYDYAYTNRNAATGDTIECRVKRTGDSVEIYLESKPATPQPPVKGSVEHEAQPSA